MKHVLIIDLLKWASDQNEQLHMKHTLIIDLLNWDFDQNEKFYGKF